MIPFIPIKEINKCFQTINKSSIFCKTNALYGVSSFGDTPFFVYSYSLYLSIYLLYLPISLLYARTRARAHTRSLYYIYACTYRSYFAPKNWFSSFWHSKPSFLLKIATIDFQSVTKKVHFFMHFFAKIFGQFKKKLYLCTRFWETSVFRFSTARRGH